MRRKDVHIFGLPLGLILVVLYKFVWGLGEVVVGMALLFSASIIRGELAEDPQDVLVNWLLHHSPFSAETSGHLGTVLLGLGILKLLIATGLLFRSWKVRQWLLVFLVVITAFAATDMLVQPTVIKSFTLVTEILILLYIWKVLPRHLPKHFKVSEPRLI